MMLPVNLGDRIRTAREAAGLSQEELAGRVGVTQRTVGNWERGTASPRSKIGALEKVLFIHLRGDTSRADLPRLDEASDAQLVVQLAGRLADRTNQVLELTRQLDEFRSASTSPTMPQKWAARTRDNGDHKPGPDGQP